MSAIVTAIIAMLQTILPVIGTSQQVASIITTLITLIPTLVKEAQDLVQPVKNIIASLQMNAATTDEQMAALKELDAKVDAEFEAAATAAQTQDAAP